jgi:geranylgeranyl pyrophosphate synthase
LDHVKTFESIQDRIQLVEERIKSQSDGHHPELGAALDHLLSSGGKRIRPTVTLLMGGMLEADPDRLINLAAAIEMLHTATLVHDDLIDGALLRRGIPTLNAQWTPAATVLAGDFIFSRAAKLASETNSVVVMQMFAETLTVIVNGEITQMFASKGLSLRDEYFERIYAKTASLFEVATLAAAVLSGVDDDIQEVARTYGYEIGMAFQIVDDVLDFTSEQSTIGKPVAGDLRQGLITLPAINYMDDHPDDPDLLYLLKGNHYHEENITRLAQAIVASGAIGETMNEANQYVDRAIKALMELPESPERDALEDLAKYIVHRNY